MNAASIILSIFMGAFLLLLGVGGVLIFARRRPRQPAVATTAPTTNEKPFPWLAVGTAIAFAATMLTSTQIWELVSTTEVVWYKNPILLASAAGLIASSIWLMPSGTIIKSKPGKLVLFIAGLIPTWYFWPELLRLASDWFVTTPTGVKSELTVEQIIANRWWIDLVAVSIGLFILWMIWPKKPKKEGTQSGNHTSWSTYVGNTVVILTIVAITTGFYVWIGALHKVGNAASEYIDEQTKLAAEQAKRGYVYAHETMSQAQNQKYPIEDTCTGDYAKWNNCRKVTLKDTATYSFQSDVEYQPHWFPAESVAVVDHGMGSIDVTSKHGNLVTVYIFQSPIKK